MPETFVRRCHFQVSPERLFVWHAEPGAFARLAPPGEPIEQVSPDRGLREGERVELRIGLGPFRFPWTAEIRDVRPGLGFRDIQIRGPFRRWEHEHRMEPDGADGSWLEDRITYELPLGFLGRWLAGPLIRKKLDRLFAYRHWVTAKEVGPASGGPSQ
ncbi:MAG TPA: SRPBCC family protein [Thermoanaerobaculia bacterium]|nr:SRPBCC family protein [Thermoanaerobaculia bacterium]